MLVVSLISLLIAMVKNFRYEVNYFVAERDYPFEFQNSPFHNPPQWKVIVIIVFNAICDSTIYIIFFIIHLVIDVILVVQFRKTIEEKKAKFQMQADEKRKKEDDNKNKEVIQKERNDKNNKNDETSKNKAKKEDDPVERSIRMVVSSTLSNFFLRLIMAILSLSDLFLLITKDYSTLDVHAIIHYFDFEYFMKYICSASKSCQLLRKYGNLLYLVSLTINLFFFYKFDKKFNIAFRQLIFPVKKVNAQNPQHSIVKA
jgi:ABC-type multidrug transport system fused ATPase/permease subunit